MGMDEKAAKQPETELQRGLSSLPGTLHKVHPPPRFQSIGSPAVRAPEERRHLRSPSDWYASWGTKPRAVSLLGEVVWLPAAECIISLVP